jgi:hypothetical protein
MEMVQEPAFISECLFEVLISYELIINVENEFQKITPTSKKVIFFIKKYVIDYAENLIK